MWPCLYRNMSEKVVFRNFPEEAINKECSFWWVESVLWSYWWHCLLLLMVSQNMEKEIYDNCYAPNFKEVGGAYCFSGVCLFFLPSVTFVMHSITLKPCMLGFWNFIYGFLMKKIADTYFFFSSGLFPFSQLWPFKENGWKLVSKISQKLLKLEPWKFVNGYVVISRWPD